MIFAEKKTDTGFTYDLEEIFGTVHLESSIALEGEMLDAIVMTLLKDASAAQEITGEVTHALGSVRYTFTKRSQWEEDNEIELCNDIPTSTSEQENGSTPPSPSNSPRKIESIWSWLRRCAGALHAEWKSGRRYQQEGIARVRERKGHDTV